ncbi:hypothetical protein [Sphingobium aquiterrae]|uniref:hypothetical protein n=1 Tax=Sphingobium aquiterrae TaxID=2038656 RepID=UPI0030196353
MLLIHGDVHVVGARTPSLRLLVNAMTKRIAIGRDLGFSALSPIFPEMKLVIIMRISCIYELAAIAAPAFETGVKGQEGECLIVLDGAAPS